MNCPVCHKTMVEENFGGALVDVCKNGCKGIWFDWFELVKLDEKSEGLGEVLQEALQSPRVSDVQRGKMNCPRCSTLMHIHRHKSAKEINVDECAACGGFFLDAGELAAIRDNFMNDKEREAYQKRLIAEMPEYSATFVSLEKQKARNEAIGRFTWLLSPGYYHMYHRRSRRRTKRTETRTLRKDQAERIAALKVQLKKGLITEQDFANETASILSELE